MSEQLFVSVSVSASVSVTVSASVSAAVSASASASCHWLLSLSLRLRAQRREMSELRRAAEERAEGTCVLPTLWNGGLVLHSYWVRESTL